MPDHKAIKEHKQLQCFGSLLHDPNLWHLNRRSVSGAFAVGMFCAFIPIPLQMLIAAAIAIAVRVNLPISVGVVWITNPVTFPPMFYAAYRVGVYILGWEVIDIDFTLSWDSLADQIALIWEPLLLGCLIVGSSAAVISFFTVRLLWRLHIMQHLEKRKLRRKKNA